MVEGNVHGAGLPPGSQTVEPPAQTRLGERERPTQARRLFPSFFLFFSFLLPIIWLSSQSFLFPSSADQIAENASSGNVPYQFQVQMATPQHQIPGGQIFNLPGQQTTGYQMGRGQSPGAFGMSAMAGALPEYQNTTSSQMSHQDSQRFLAGTSSTSSSYQAQQFPGQAPLSTGNYPVHPPQYPYQQAYGQLQASPQSSHPSGPNPVHSSYPGGAYFPTSQQQYIYYPGQYGQSPQPQHGSYPTSYGPGSTHAYGQQGGDVSAMAGRTMHSGYPPGTVVPYSSYGSPGAYLRPGSLTGKRSFYESKSWLTTAIAVSRGNSGSSSGSVPSSPRGPPRKPKQSGHALWVGNLPSGTVISDLKDHFSKDATKDIESVFLISKSNCAFVNYRSEGACAAAMSRFHDSRFQGVRLVCRLRRNSNTSAPGVPTGPAALMPSVTYMQTAFEAIKQNREVSFRALEEAAAESTRTGEPTVKVMDKYFVLKSLTVEDMELSVRNSIWATQSHNEDALNKAYEVSNRPRYRCAQAYTPSRHQKMYISSFRQTSLESISEWRAWLLPSPMKRLQGLSGLLEAKRCLMIPTFLDRYRRRPRNLRPRAVSLMTLPEAPYSGKLTRRTMKSRQSSIMKLTTPMKLCKLRRRRKTPMMPPFRVTRRLLASHSRLNGLPPTDCPFIAPEGLGTPGMPTGKSRSQETVQNLRRVLAEGWSRCSINRPHWKDRSQHWLGRPGDPTDPRWRHLSSLAAAGQQSKPFLSFCSRSHRVKVCTITTYGTYGT